VNGPAPLPIFREVVAPDGWQCIDLISDLHLSESTPATFAAFRDHLLHTRADAVFVLGDLFEVWVGDDARYEGFDALICAALSAASKRRVVGFMPGNRDFLAGTELLESTGVVALSDPSVLVAFGERLLLTHGDALCLADTDYQRFRAEVRSPVWQEAFLGQPLPERRAVAARLRAQSEARKRGQVRENWADVDAATAVRWMHEAGTPTLVHGHTHRAGSNWLAPGYIRHVLSDWDLDDPLRPRAEVLRWWRGGLLRIPPEKAP
jgi:UDP-2,3-diacylglucosamine hydrolase